MNPKTTVILLVVFLLTVAGAIYLSQDTKTTKPEDASLQAGINDAGNDTLIFDSKDIGLSISQFMINLDRNTIHAKIYDGQWRTTSPHSFRAQSTVIDQMLSVVSNLQGTVIDHTDLVALTEQTYEGAGNKLTWTGKVITLYGNVGHIFIRLHQRLGAGRAGVSTVVNNIVTYYNADDALHDLVETIDLHTFYQRSIDPLLMPETGRIEITTGESTSVLTQQNGQWRIGAIQDAERALEFQLDQYPGVNDYFSLLEKIQIQDFHSYDRDAGLEPFGLHKPLITARFIAIDDEPNNRAVGKMLRVGVPVDPSDQTRFASYGRETDNYPLVFTIPTPIALAFAQDATAFRDPRIMAMPVELIESIMLRFAGGDGQRIDLANGNRPMLYPGRGDPRELSVGQTAEQLKRIGEARAKDFVPVDSASQRILVSVTLKPRLLDENESFTISADPASEVNKPTVLIRRGEEPVALRVEKESVAGLLYPGSLLEAAPSR